MPKTITINIEKSRTLFDRLTELDKLDWGCEYSPVMNFEIPDNFSLPEGMTNKGTIRNLIGLSVEVKIKEENSEELPKLPAFMYPMLVNADKFNFAACIDDKNKEELISEYDWTLMMSCHGLSIFSDTAFSGSPTEDDIILNDCIYDAIRALPLRTTDYFDNIRAGLTRFRYAEFGDELIKKYHYICVNGAKLYYYEDGYYKADIAGRKLDYIIYNEYDSIKYNEKRDVVAYVKAKSYIDSGNIELDPYIINVKNGILDCSNGQVKLLEHTPNRYCFTQIPVMYNPEAPEYSFGRRSLQKTFGGDQQIMEAFEEILGLCLVRDVSYQRAFVFVGEGGCGKSTVIEMIQAFLGARSYSTVDINQLQHRFGPAGLEDKLANFDDDIDYQSVIARTANIKKVITGDEIMIERKGEQAYKIKPYATQIWGANGLPSTKEMEYSIIRRFTFVPFTNNFTKKDPDYDPHVLNKLKTEECKTWLLNIAIKGLMRYMKTNRLTKIEASDEYMKTWQIDNNPVLEWVEENAIEDSHILSILSTALYEEFREWAESIGMAKIPSNKYFYKEVAKKFNVVRTDNVIRNGVKGRFFEVA